MGGVENKASGIQRLGRNQEAYDKFAQAVEVPLMVVTILWLPVLIVPLVRPVHGSVAQTLAVIDYMVWALFALEYVVKLFLAPNRWKFVRTHILDLLIVAVPFFRPLGLVAWPDWPGWAGSGWWRVGPSGGANRY